MSISAGRVGLITALVVGVVCVVSSPPAHTPYPVFVLVVASGVALWCLGILGLPRGSLRQALAFVGYGVSGAALDAMQPWGPGFVAAFIAVAALALALPVRPAAVAATPVLVTVGTAEALTSEYPMNAVLNIALGVGFFFAASAFAALSRDASARAQEVLQRTAEAQRANEEAAALAERARLARELHDVLAHTLSGLTLQLEAARLLARRTDTDTRVIEQLELAHRSARVGVDEGKRAIAALRGEPLVGVGHIRPLVDTFARDSGIATSLEITGTARPLAPEAELALFRTVQESLSNVRKHAPQSTSVAVTLEWEPDAVRARIRNIGTAPPPALGRGFGLEGMSERAASLGGRCASGPTADGFETTAVLPYETRMEGQRRG